LTLERPYAATAGAKAALERIRSTDGILRREESEAGEVALRIGCDYCKRGIFMARFQRDEELEKLEEDIRILKNKYDQFFAGISKWPPAQERKNLEVFIHELGRQKWRENTRRFRFNTLLTRFNQFREMWARKMREREEGPMDFNRRKAALDAQPEPPRAAPPPAARPVTSEGADPYVKLTRGSNGEQVRELYAQIEKEQQRLGKPPSVTFEQLSAMVQKQSELVRTKYQVDAVAFRVDVVDGKVKLKAKPLQDRE
jgi:hypothetical protein